MIRIGTAGIPISSKGQTTAEGIETAAELGLNAFEVEFVRRVGMNNDTAKEVGEVARKVGISLSAHCPYFINLCSNEPDKLEASKKRIMDSAERAFHMGAGIIVFHPGWYGKLDHVDAREAVADACLDMMERLSGIGVKGVTLGMETTGKISQFGTLDELVKLCSEIKGCAPVVDFAHIFARQAGKINYPEVLDKLKPLKMKHLHSHFTSIGWTPAKIEGQGNEWHHLEMKINEPPFEPLAREILERKLDITIISESPILEKDALKMKSIFEKLGHKF